MWSLTDNDLINRAQNGDVDAMGELYDRHQAKIFKYVRARIYNHQMAQDLTGEIFLKMVANIQSFRQMGLPFTAWLYRIAHNHLINAIQQDKTDLNLPISLAMNNSRPLDNPAVLVEEKLQFNEIAIALEKIDPIQGEVIILRFLAGLSLQETADSLDKTVASIKATQYRGLRALQVALKS